MYVKPKLGLIQAASRIRLIPVRNGKHNFGLPLLLMF